MLLKIISDETDKSWDVKTLVAKIVAYYGTNYKYRIENTLSLPRTHEEGILLMSDNITKDTFDTIFIWVS